MLSVARDWTRFGVLGFAAGFVMAGFVSTVIDMFLLDVVDPVLGAGAQFALSLVLIAGCALATTLSFSLTTAWVCAMASRNGAGRTVGFICGAANAVAVCLGYRFCKSIVVMLLVIPASLGFVVAAMSGRFRT